MKMINNLSYNTVKAFADIKQHETEVLLKRIEVIIEMYNYDKYNNKEIFIKEIPILINLYNQAKEDFYFHSTQLELMEKTEEEEGENNDF